MTMAMAAALAAAGGNPSLSAMQSDASSRPEATSHPEPAGPPPGARITDEGWFAPREANRPPLPKEITRAFVIPVREAISGKTLDAIERKVKHCRQSGAELIILDMDTWGGELIAGLDISRFLKATLGDIYVTCYVRTRAISAGAMIAMACDEIVMTPVGHIGDCEPITTEGGSVHPAGEKYETEVRTDFRESAKRCGYNQALSVSMVSIGADSEVWEIRNKKTRELQYVPANSPQTLSRVARPGATTAPADPDSEWELLKVVVPPNRLLTMSTTEAVGFGFVQQVVTPSLEAPYQCLRDLYHIQGEPTVLDDTWSEKLVEFLTSAEVTGILIFAAIVCGYIEFNVPGHIVPGIIAVLCVALAFGSRYLGGMANWWAIALFAVGVVLILLEIFVLTGFGFPAVLGIICCVVGLVAMLLPYSSGPIPLPKSSMDWNIFLNALFAMGVGFVCAVVAVFALASYLPKLPLAGRLVLAPVTTAPDSALTDASPLLRVNPGDVGIVESVCRPVGKVRFGEDLLDAVSEGGIIESAAEVRVLRREGNRVVVEKA
jgi:membrane-bound serine protease (ClpP class)